MANKKDTIKQGEEEKQTQKKQTRYDMKMERRRQQELKRQRNRKITIAVAVIVDNAAGRTEIPLSDIQNKTGNLGKVFNLDTITLLTVLNAAERAGYVKVVRTAGLDLLHILTKNDYLECVKQYYAQLS
jgi:hypothetical protein